MKFRKTKLTALAMSVLMAASTITSVTWAADLFTDGADVATEVVVEASENEVLDTSEVEVAEETQLLGDNYVVDYPIVTQSRDPDQTRSTGETGVYKENGLWVLYYKYMDKNGGVQPSGDAKSYILKEGDYTYTAATCVKAETITLHLTLNDSNIPEAARKVTGSAIEFGDKDTKDGHGYAVTINVPVRKGTTAASCDNRYSNNDLHTDLFKYESYSYVGCSYCGRVYNSKDNKYENYTPYGDNGAGKFENLSSAQLAEYGIEIITSYPQHNFSDWKYAEIPFTSVDDVDVNNFGVLKTAQEIYDAAKNAKVTNNKLDVYDRTKPALVRRWRECTKCNYIEPAANTDDCEGQWYLFWTGEKEETDIFYMYDSKALSNIKGFVYVGKDANNIPALAVKDGTPFADENGLVEGTYYVPADQFMGVVLKNCNLGGLYYECHFINDYTKEYVIDKQISVSPQEHTYGSVYVDVSKSDTQIDNLAKDATYGSNGIKVKRDAKGNVTLNPINSYSKRSKLAKN